MTVSASSSDLMSRFERVCIRGEADITNTSGQWVVTLVRPGQPPIIGAAIRLPDAVAEAVSKAESLGWHRPDAPKG